MQITLRATPLKVDTLEELGGTLQTTITDTQEKLINGDMKYVVTLGDDEYSLILNDTNLRALVKGFGSKDTEDWGGRLVECYVGTLIYKKEEQPGVRVRVPDQAAKPAEKTVTAADLVDPAGSGDAITDDIPF